MNRPKAEHPETETEAGAEPDDEEAPEAAAESPQADATDPEAAAEVADEPAELDPEAEIADLNDKLLRSLAEIENLRRRGQKEREDTAKYAIAGFARDLLSVADNLGRALAVLPEGADQAADEPNGFVEGVRLTERELMGVLERHGVEKIEPLGEKFDPNLHEAMFEIPTGDSEPGTVVQVVEVGYVLKERLLRAAKVGVARPLPESGEHVDTTA